MDLPTQAHLATLRDLLNHRLRELSADVHAAETARQEASVVAAHEVTDRKDEALQEQVTGVDDAQPPDLIAVTAVGVVRGEGVAGTGRVDGSRAVQSIHNHSAVF